MMKLIGKKRFKLALTAALILCLLTGCAAFHSGIHDLHGSIIGNRYTIDTFDNFGERVMKVSGKRSDIDPHVMGSDPITHY